MNGEDRSLDPTPPVASSISQGGHDLQEELLQCPEYRFRLLFESIRRSDGVSDTDSDRLVRNISCTASSISMRKRKSGVDSAEAESPKEKKEKSEPLVAPDFECNICFELAKEPVVTCCGHLFCWPCLYRWLHVHCSYGECPVCKGKVSESSIVPIYGRGSSETRTEKKSEEEGATGLKIPPRPQGNRVESLRQQLLGRPSTVAALEERLHVLFEESRPRGQNLWGLTRHASQQPASIDGPFAGLSTMFTELRSTNSRSTNEHRDSEPGISQTSNSSTIARMQGINYGIGPSAEPSRGSRRRTRRVSSVALGRSGQNNAGVVLERTSADTNDSVQPNSGHSMVLRSRTRRRLSDSSSAD